MAELLIFMFLAGLSFLYALNLFLRGRLREVVGGGLGLLIFGIVIASFFFIGWRGGY